MGDAYLILPALRTKPRGRDVCKVEDAETMLHRYAFGSASLYIPFLRELPLGPRISAQNEGIPRDHGYILNSVQRVSHLQYGVRDHTFHDLRV